MPDALADLDAQARRLLAEVPTEAAPHDVETFLHRLHRWGPDLLDALGVYSSGGRAPDMAQRVLRLVVRAYAARRPALRCLDDERILRPDWFAGPEQVGYVCYAERFAGTLRGVRRKLDYLADLGVTYLHLMPLLASREGPDDGGYAVVDYRRVRPDLGTMDDLADLAEALHARGMALTLDLVLNHVAKEHAWAQAAARGEAPYNRYFLTYPDRALPDAYERTLPEVFPDFAPGSFTWVEQFTRVDADPSRTGRLRGARRPGAWVWTTFNSFQWDLDWSNPDVFCEMLDVILHLANVGVDCVRLDAIAFLWKRIGTTCQGEPEVHDIVQALRAATRIAAPSVIFKAEAIVAPELLPAYLGTGRHAGKVCDLAYHNSLMVQLWSALAMRDARLAERALGVPPPKPTTTSWGTYVRCHDDIGWAVSDTDAQAVGLDGFAHRSFLSSFYSGQFPGTFARGRVFQANPATGDARISGTLASLAGLEAALDSGSPHDVGRALGRIFLLHAVVFGYGGIPLVYMGDELGLLNDDSYLDEQALAGDNRWVHRPYLPWDAAARRHDPGTIEARIFDGLTHLARVRAGLASLHAAVEAQPVPSGTDGVLALLRRHPAGTLLQLYNVTDAWQHVPASTIAAAGLSDGWEHLSAFAPEPDGGAYAMPPYAAWWVTPR